MSLFLSGQTTPRIPFRNRTNSIYPMKGIIINMQKKTLRIILISVFILGFVLAFIGRFLSYHSPENYRERQDEIFTPEQITDVWLSEDNIYLCHRFGSYANVYDRDGNFKWAVSAPYMKNAQFLLTDTELIIFGKEAFVYDVNNGKFIEVRKTDGLDEALNTPTEGTEPQPPKAGDLSFSWYKISELQEDGSKVAIITRPAWHIIFNFYLDLLLSAIAAITAALIVYAEKIKAWLTVRGTDVITHEKAANYRVFIITVSVVQTLTAIANIFIGSTTLVGIMTAHFLIAGVITYNLIENLSPTEYERKMFDFLKATGIATYNLLFLSLSFCF